jgi:hypothetical protein
VEIKAAVVAGDERETSATGGRALLNLGHTFGHAIEATAGYGTYLHGEAVAIGLVMAARLSADLEALHAAAEATAVAATVRAHGLPDRLRAPLPLAPMLAAMKRDKKVRAGKLRFVLLQGIGTAVTADDVPEDRAARGLRRRRGGRLNSMLRGLPALLACLLLAACAPEPTTPAAPTTPGPVRIGEAGYIRSWPGELPIVLSVPHDGAIAPAEIPDRTTGVTVRDSHARALAEAIRDSAAGAVRPRAAPDRLRGSPAGRSTATAALAEGATDPVAIRTWREYHGAIDAAEQAVLARSPHGLYLDLHSHGHPKKRLEIGYLLKADDLRLPDSAPRRR